MIDSSIDCSPQLLDSFPHAQPQALQSKKILADLGPEATAHIHTHTHTHTHIHTQRRKPSVCAVLRGFFSRRKPSCLSVRLPCMSVSVCLQSQPISPQNALFLSFPFFFCHSLSFPFLPFPFILFCFQFPIRRLKRVAPRAPVSQQASERLSPIHVALHFSPHPNARHTHVAEPLPVRSPPRASPVPSARPHAVRHALSSFSSQEPSTSRPRPSAPGLHPHPRAHPQYPD